MSTQSETQAVTHNCTHIYVYFGNFVITELSPALKTRQAVARRTQPVAKHVRARRASGLWPQSNRCTVATLDSLGFALASRRTRAVAREVCCCEHRAVCVCCERILSEWVRRAQLLRRRADVAATLAPRGAARLAPLWHDLAARDALDLLALAPAGVALVAVVGQGPQRLRAARPGR